MEQIFKSVLLISAAGSFLTLILLLLKPVTRRVFGNIWQYYIWLLVLAIMVLPVNFNTPKKDVLNFTGGTAANNIVLSQEESMVYEEQPGVQMGNDETSYKESFHLDFMKILISLWVSGALIFFSGGVLSYIRFMRLIKKNSEYAQCGIPEKIKTEEGIKKRILVKKTNMLSAPLLTGIFRNVLLLPDCDMNESELELILKHELTHLKRHDLWYKWFAFLVNSIHWFNPFVYLIVKQINEECEISCDATVTKNMDDKRKNEYMNVIVKLASAKKGGK